MYVCRPMYDSSSGFRHANMVDHSAAEKAISHTSNLTFMHGFYVVT